MATNSLDVKAAAVSYARTEIIERKLVPGCRVKFFHEGVGGTTVKAGTVIGFVDPMPMLQGHAGRGDCAALVRVKYAGTVSPQSVCPDKLTVVSEADYLELCGYLRKPADELKRLKISK